MIDLRYEDIRILIEKSAGDTLDVAPFLIADSPFQIARSPITPDLPILSGTTLTIAKAYNDLRTSESFDYRINDRFKPGRKVTIQILWEGVWRSPPFGAETFIKFAYAEDAKTHEICEIETHDAIAQRIELDSASDPERKYDAAGNEVLQTRDVMGVIRSLADIAKSAYHNKGLTLTVPGGLLTQATNASQEYWGDTADSILNATQQWVFYNPDRALELNGIAKIGSAISAFSFPLDLSVVTPSKRLLDLVWGNYTNDLTVYRPERNTEQLCEYVEVRGIASQAIQRPTTIVDGGLPNTSSTFSFNTPVNPITSTLTTTTFNWAALTIDIDAKTYSTAQAIQVSGGASAGFGNTLVQQDATKKIFDSRRRLGREELKRYVPDALKLGAGSSSAIGTPAYQKETIYILSSNDRVLGTIVNETAANAITGASGSPAGLGQLQTQGRSFNSLGQGVNISSGGMVASPSLAQGAIPYFPGSYGGGDERANAPQAEYFPDQWYKKDTPQRRKVRITWGAVGLTGRVKPIDVGSALLTGDKFDLLAASLARLHTAQHSQHTCEFPLTTGLFTDWQTPGKVISVLEAAKGKRFHYFASGDSIEFSRDSVVCKTNLFWIGTTDEATGIPYPGPLPVVETFYLLDENGDILTDENGDRLVWRT